MKIRELFENDDKSGLIDVINRMCPRNFRSIVEGGAVKLFRGINSTASKSAGEFKYIVVSKRESPRSSKTGTNLFMDYVSTAPEWQVYPKRTYANSTTPTADVAHAHGTGTVFLVIPADSVKGFGYMDEDFNEKELSRSDNSSILSIGFAALELINSIRKLMGNVRKYPEGYPDELELLIDHPAVNHLDIEKNHLTYNEIVEMSDLVEKTLNILKGKDISDSSLYGYLDSYVEDFEHYYEGTSILKFMKKHVSPRSMGVRYAEDIQDIPPSEMVRDTEVWFVGPHLLISYENGAADEDIVENLQSLLEDVK